MAVEHNSVELQYLSRAERGQMEELKQRIAEIDGVTRLLFAAQQLTKFERIARDSRNQAETLAGEDRLAMTAYADDVESLVTKLRSQFLTLETRETRH